MPEWPTSGVGQLPNGLIRCQVDDFRVREHLKIEPCGFGEHRYLRIEKCKLTTREVAKVLAKHYQVKEIDIGFAGQKDKWSRSTQWFSVRTSRSVAFPNSKHLRLLEETSHSKKLRRSDCASNQFSIAIRKVVPIGVVNNIPKEVPNYFGEQRFGRDGNNVVNANKWLEKNRPRISPFLKSIYLSATRSFLFNVVLAQRVKLRNWNVFLKGDVEIEGSPSGPLWGRGSNDTQDTALDIESEALEPYEELCAHLEWTGLNQDRRSLKLTPQDASFEQVGDQLNFEFTLPSGTYATAVLREVIAYEDAVAKF